MSGVRIYTCGSARDDWSIAPNVTARGTTISGLGALSNWTSSSVASDEITSAVGSTFRSWSTSAVWSVVCGVEHRWRVRVRGAVFERFIRFVSTLRGRLGAIPPRNVPFFT
eukprot:6140310-Prymnesium_polylepis.2